MRKCLWTSLRIHIVTGFCMPLASLGMWIYGADSRNRTDPSLYKSNWPIRPPKVVQVIAKRKGRQAAWEKWSRPLDDLWLGVCKRATSRQPASDQQKAVNLTIPPTFICCQLPETQQNHKGLDNLFIYVSAFLVSFPFFQSGEMLRVTPSCIIGDIISVYRSHADTTYRWQLTCFILRNHSTFSMIIVTDFLLLPAGWWRTQTYADGRKTLAIALLTTISPHHFNSHKHLLALWLLLQRITSKQSKPKRKSPSCHSLVLDY